MHGILDILNKVLNNQTVRNGSLFTFFSFCSSGISFVLLIILARFIAPEGYGHVSLFNTIVTLLGFVISLNTVGLLSVNYFIQTKDDFCKTFVAVSNITCTCFVLLAILIFLFSNIIQETTGFSILYLYLALIISFANTYTQNLLNIWRIEENIFEYGIYSIAFSFGYFSLAVLLVVGCSIGWEGQVFALSLINILFLIISIYITIKKGYLRFVHPSKVHYIDCLKFGIPLIPHSISGWLRQGLDRIFINNFQSVDFVGLFGFALNFATILLMIGTAFNNTNSVFISKNLASNTKAVRAKLRKQTFLIIFLFIVLMALIWGGAFIFIPFIFPKYVGCIPYLFPVCLGAFFQCVYLQFVNFLFFFKRTKILMYITSGISIIHALSSYYLTQYSISFTIWLGVFTNFLIALFVFLYSRKVYKII